MLCSLTSFCKYNNAPCDIVTSQIYWRCCFITVTQSATTFINASLVPNGYVHLADRPQGWARGDKRSSVAWPVDLDHIDAEVLHVEGVL